MSRSAKCLKLHYFWKRASNHSTVPSKNFYGNYSNLFYIGQLLQNAHTKKKNMILNPRSCVPRTSLASSSGIPVYQEQRQVARELNGCPVCQTLWRWTATKLAEHVFHRQIGRCHCHRGKQTLPHSHFWLIEHRLTPTQSTSMFAPQVQCPKHLRPRTATTSIMRNAMTSL